MAARVADVLVVPQAGGEREQALGDAGDEAGHGVGAVAFERELALDGVDDRFDPLAHASEAAEPAGLVLRSGRRKIAPSSVMSVSKSSPAKPLSAITV